MLYGVVTEICVAAASRALLERGYRVHIVQDAVRALDEAKAESLMTKILHRGGDLTTTAEVLGGHVV
jgi:nicotinamidase-related amidase